MPGVPGRSGGHNRLSVEQHILRGSFRRDRHERPDPEPPTLTPVSAADRRRTLKGLSPGARALAARLLNQFEGWTESSLQTLRFYCEAVERVKAATDDSERRRETRVMLALLRSLELER